MARIYAHRGASAELPENTLPAFARAVELGAYGIELDIHLTRDGKPVVIHDKAVDRTTDGAGPVADFEYLDLVRLDAGGGAKIPSLEEVLDLVGDGLHIDIEVKAAAAADAVLRVASSRPALRFAVSSFDHDVLHHLRSQSPETELWPLAHAASDDTLDAAAKLGSRCIAIHDAFINQEIVEYLRTRGIEAWVWTVNDHERAAELVALGVAGICTDDPALLLRQTGN